MLPKHKAPVIYTHDGKYFFPLVHLNIIIFLCASLCIKNIYSFYIRGAVCFQLSALARVLIFDSLQCGL